MSPTIGLINKQDQKVNKNEEMINNFHNILRHNESTQDSKQKEAWKPQISKVLAEGFDKIKQAQKLQKLNTCTKSESPVKKSAEL